MRKKLHPHPNTPLNRHESYDEKTPFPYEKGRNVVPCKFHESCVCNASHEKSGKVGKNRKAD